MLTPFRGYLPTRPPPATAAAAASLARGMRDEAGRYQPGEILDRAVADGRLTRAESPCLYRYTITGADGVLVTGIVGAAAASELVPHEATVRGAPYKPAPSLEIRPVLAIAEEPLPEMRDLVPAIAVLDGEGREHAAAPVAIDGALPPGPYVVADGHHRRRAAMHSQGPGCLVLTLLVGSSGAGLSAGTFHRRFTAAGPLPASVGARFDVESITEPVAVEGALVWVDAASGRAFRLTPLPEALEALLPEHRDSATAVASALLYPLIGVTEEDAVYAETTEAALAGLLPGERALLLPAITISTVLAAARSGWLLPAKSSRFRPKPLRGIVMRQAAG